MVRFAVPPVSISGPAVNSGSVSVVAIIPARYQSSRLPGKALADIAGQPMIEHVYRRTAAARSVGVVIVATDDQRICDAVEAFGGRAQLTSSKHQSGTDRLAEVAAGLTCDVVVNVQGDEPLIEPSMIDDAVAPFRVDPCAPDEHAPATDRRPCGTAEPERHQGGGGPGRLRVVFFPRADSVHARRLPAGARLAAHRPLRLPARMPAAAHRRCRRRRWSRPKRSSSCARSSTASGSRQSRRLTIRSASTRPRIWRG